MEPSIMRHPELTFATMDALDIGTLTDEYAFVVDKGGADSILVRDDAREQMPKVLEGIKQVLKPGCAYCMISFGVPENRMHFLNPPEQLSAEELVRRQEMADSMAEQEDDFPHDDSDDDE